MSRRTLRWVALVLALAPAVSGLSACSSETEGIREVQAAIDETRLQAHRFRYTVSTAESGSFQVQGLVEDDFRYKARLLRGRTPVFDEIVNDDAIAVRFIEPALIGSYVDAAQRTTANLDTDLPGVTVIDALSAKRWVLDPSGAPSLTDPSRALRNIGVDPVFDALGVYAYVEQAMREAFEVHRWSADDLNPAYRASEDVFPRPSRDSGIRRYDLRRPWLPPIGAAGATDDLPATKHFRKMAIYVKDGVIVRVMERVEITGRAGDDFISYLENLARESGISEEAIRESREQLRGLDDRERSDLLLEILNQVLDAAGITRVAARVMTFDVLEIGASGIDARLPTDVIEGSLAILLNRGAKVDPALAAAGTPAAPATSRTGGANGTTPATGDADR